MPVNSFKWKHYAGEIILLNVRWYLKYALSYRNLEEMMAERGVKERIRSFNSGIPISSQYLLFFWTVIFNND